MNICNDIFVLFEHQHFVAINKPAGIMAHGDGRSNDLTIVDWINKEFPQIIKNSVGEDFLREEKGREIKISRPGIVHRLDKETSGVMLIAKTNHGFEVLKDLFKERLVQKTYAAWVYGWAKQDGVIIDQPIGRSKKDIRKYIAGKGARGNVRTASTQISVRQRMVDDAGNRFMFIHASPRSGRTHQIRVHVSWWQHPVVADTLYGGKRAKNPAKQNLGFDRQALHALKIEFKFEEEEFKIAAPLTLDFMQAQKMVRQEED
jgi:23S rRNA pseudouridine1911/1915/1917 synthase